MSAAIAVPHHKLSESPNTRSIELNDWFITASTNPISNAGQSDALQAELGIPLPEMTFGNNYLTLEHRSSGWKYAFSTGKALSGVKRGELGEGDGGVKVEYADAWLKSRYGPSLIGVLIKCKRVSDLGQTRTQHSQCPRRFLPNRTIGPIRRHIQVTHHPMRPMGIMNLLYTTLNLLHLFLGCPLTRTIHITLSRWQN